MLFDKIEVPVQNPYISTDPTDQQSFKDAFEDLAKLLNLKHPILLMDGKILRFVIEREVITNGFDMIMTGVMLGVKDHLNTMNITCKINIAYILPKLPVRYVTVEGSYYDGWKLNYKE